MENYSFEKLRIERLVGATNYHPWSAEAKDYLIGQDAWDIVEIGLSEAPEPTDQEGQEDPKYESKLKAWKAQRVLNSKANTYITGTCSIKIKKLIARYPTARGKWDALSRMYAPKDRTAIRMKKAEFHAFQARKGEDMVSILSRLDELELQISYMDPDSEPNEDDKISILIATLKAYDTRLAPALALIEFAIPALDYETISTRLVEIERQIGAVSGMAENAMRAYEKPKKTFNGECFNCGKKGHRQADCRSPKKEEKGVPSSEKGYNRPSTGPLPTPTGGRGLSPDRANQARETAWVASTIRPRAIVREGNSQRAMPKEACWKALEGPPLGSELDWIVDSGCTRHMTFMRESFKQDYKELDTPVEIETASGGSIYGIGTGSVSIRVVLRGRMIPVRLSKVLYVPNVAGNLISVSQLQDNGITMRTTIRPKKQLFLEKNGRTIGVADRQGKSYVLNTARNDPEPGPEVALLSSTGTGSSAETWHRRFGHLGWSTLEGISTVTTGLTNLPRFVSDCSVCNMTKSVRVINRVAPERASRPLERIHTDVWGPYGVATRDGATYFITFTDDYSRKSWVYLARARTELYITFRLFRAETELETGLKIIKVRADNAPEYHRLAEDVRPDGIVFEFTTSYTPEQNGVSERLNRYLAQVSRAMLLDAKLPLYLWGEAVETASYLRNRTPIGPNRVTPEEAYSGQKPYVGHLRAYGCLAYAHIPKENRDKLEPNSVRTCLIGYMRSSRQYKLLNPVTGKIILSTAPRFVENQRIDYNWNEPTAGDAIIPFDPTVAPDQSVVPIFNPAAGFNHVNDVRAADRPVVNDRPEIRPDVDPFDLPLTSRDQEPVPETYVDSETIIVDDGETVEPVVRAEIPTAQELRGGRSDPNVEDESVDEAEPAEDAESVDDDEPVNENDPIVKTQLLRRSIRVAAPPKRWEPPLPQSRRRDRANLANEKLPKDYDEAMADLNRGSWELAIQEELVKLQSLGTWEYQDLPKGRRTVGSKWVFNIKYTPNGLIDRYKARLVAQGFSQTLGDDYLETFSPTMRGESLRTLLAIGATENLEIRQLDVVSAYPRSELHADVYMRPPKALNAPKGKVLKLNKSLYGLKQSGREWYIEACNGLKELGFAPCYSEPSIFTNDERTLIIGLYVDDMLVLGADKIAVEGTIKAIANRWEIKDLGDVAHILGMEVSRDRKRGVLNLRQQPYVLATIRTLGLGDSKAVKTPATDRKLFTKGLDDEPRADQSLYQSAIGSLLWISSRTRPDIQYEVNQLCQHNNDPTVRHWNGVLRVLRYLNGTAEYSIQYRTGQSGLLGYCDADYAGDVDDRKSVTGHVFMLGGGPVTWVSHKQRCVATSTTESEYIALSEASKQGQWIRALLIELNRPTYLGKRLVAPIRSDNMGCIAIAKDPVAHSRTKHIDVRYHYVRELISHGKTTVDYIPSGDNLADLLTKPLPLADYSNCVQGLLYVDKGEGDSSVQG